MVKKKTLNLTNYVMIILFSFLSFVFLSQTHIFCKDERNSLSGFGILTLNSSNAVDICLKLAISVCMTVFVCLIVLNVIAILIELNVIKTTKFNDLIKKLNVGLVVVLVCLSFIILVCLIFKKTDLNKPFGEELKMYDIGWAGVVNFVFSLVMFIISVILFYTEKIFKKNK